MNHAQDSLILYLIFSPARTLQSLGIDTKINSYAYLGHGSVGRLCDPSHMRCDYNAAELEDRIVWIEWFVPSNIYSQSPQVARLEVFINRFVVQETASSNVYQPSTLE